MKKKSLALVLALVLLVAFAAGGTVAWLTATSVKVENTFTVGDINIELAETTVSSYKIVPGGKDSKDPTVTVKANSENCYVYVTIDNTVVLNGQVVATPNLNTGNWNFVQAVGTKSLYRYKEVVYLSNADQKLPVFTEVTYSDAITKGNISSLNNTKITLEAFAHQSENTNQNVADDAAIAWAFPATTP